MGKLLRLVLSPNPRQIDPEIQVTLEARAGCVAVSFAFPDGTSCQIVWTPEQAQDFAADVVETMLDAIVLGGER